jgi:HSP20 family protein
MCRGYFIVNSVKEDFMNSFMFDVDRFFPTAPFGANTASSSRIETTKDAWLLEVDMPGVSRDKVDISVSGRHLEVVGEREGKERKVQYRERFRLPEPLRSTADITATLELGVLRVTIPKKNVGEERLQIALS